jgi:hypothetical protein
LLIRAHGTSLAMSAQRRTPVWEVAILLVPVVGIVLTAIVFIGGIVKVFVSRDSKSGAPPPAVVSREVMSAPTVVGADEQPASPDSASKPLATAEPKAKARHSTMVATHTPLRKQANQGLPAVR